MSTQLISAAELAFIRQLSDPNLVKLISEVHDKGWQAAQKLLRTMPGGKDLAVPYRDQQ